MNEKKTIALSSVGAAVFLTGIKLYVGLATGSLGILSEAAHSGLDLLAAIMTYLAVFLSDKPPDPEHRYGHGKVENLSALAETVLLFVTCGWIIWEAIDRLVGKGVHVEATVWSFVVMVVAIGVDYGRSQALNRVAKKYNSQALEADALHFSSDIWTSLTVIVGLVFVSIGYPLFDSIAAIFVALWVFFISYRLGRRTIDALMDRAPADMAAKMETAIREVPGVEELRSIRLRSSGPRLFVDTIVAVRRTTAFSDVHMITDAVEKAVRTLSPEADIVVHAEPQETADETLVDKIRMTVSEKGLRPPHNLEVHHKDGRRYITFDVEYPKGKSFQEAHAVSEDIEQTIYRDHPSVKKVTIHLEEYEPDEAEVISTYGNKQAMARSIRSEMERDHRILRVTDVSLLKEKDGEHALIECRVDKTRTLADVHVIVSELETHLYQQFGTLRRITIHAEPDESGH